MLKTSMSQNNVPHAHTIQRAFLITLREKCPYSELFCFVFSHIRTEYGEMRSISLYLVRMLENAGQNSSEYGLFHAALVLEKIEISV